MLLLVCYSTYGCVYMDVGNFQNFENWEISENPENSAVYWKYTSFLLCLCVSAPINQCVCVYVYKSVYLCTEGEQ